MESAEKVEAPEDVELKEVYQSFLQKCCEVGQIRFNLNALESQRLELEKQLDTTERAAKNAANKHKELQKAKFQNLKVAEEPKLEMKA